MDNIIGNQPVSGDNFYGRQDFIKYLKGLLISFNSFLLLGLRRTGKSSSLKEVIRLIKIERPDFIIIDINCETYGSIQDFYKNIYLSLPLNWRDNLRNYLKETKRIPIRLLDFITDHVEKIDAPLIGGITLRNDAISYANPLMEELTEFFKKQQTHLILVVDELPFLFENIASKHPETSKIEIEMILTTLRSWRDIGVSQAICGSLNLHIQLDTLGISRKLLGGIITQTLPKYTQDEAKGLLLNLAEGTTLDLKEENLNEIINFHPDCIPQFIQLFFFSLKTYWQGDNASIKIIYNKYVYPVIVKDFEYQFDERFSKLPADVNILAKEILHIINSKPNISEAELLTKITAENAHRVLLILANQEFIVIDENNQIDFSFKILGNWWSKKNKK